MKRSQLILWLDPKFTTLTWRLILRRIRRKRGQFKEKWSDTLRMIKQNYYYIYTERLAQKQENNWAQENRDTHTMLIKKHRIPCLRLRSKKEIRKFLKTLGIKGH